jgi:hypothetical protein
MAKHESEKIEQCVAEGERLLYEQSDLHVEVVELTRLASIKVIALSFCYDMTYTCVY